jgi:acyl carrier protein
MCGKCYKNSTKNEFLLLPTVKDFPLNSKEFEQFVRGLLSTKSYGSKMPLDFDGNESLFLHGIIDSFGLFDFIQTLQDRLPLHIKDREIHPGNFETIDQIVRFLESHVPKNS